jgi:hypothetical protein
MSTKIDALPEVTRNGHVSPGFIARPDEEWLTIGKGPYTGARFRGWVNHPPAVWKQLFVQPEKPADAIQKEAERLTAYQALFLEHDGWAVQDRQGNVITLPPLSDIKLFLDAIPQGWLNAMVGTMATAREQLPNSPTPESKPSETT